MAVPRAWANSGLSGSNSLGCCLHKHLPGPLPRLCIPRQETGLASEEASAEGEADNPNDEIPGPDEGYAKPYLELPKPTFL